MSLIAEGQIRMGATNADVSVGEVRTFLEAISLAVAQQRDLIYVTDSQFTIFAWEWAQKVAPVEPKRALLHILQETKKAWRQKVQTTGISVTLIKAMSHVGCPSNSVADKYAKQAYIRAAGEKGENRPAGVAANIDIPIAICQKTRRNQQGGMINLRYTGRMLTPPELTTVPYPRHGFETWGCSAPTCHIKDGIEFAAQLRTGVLYPHDWGQSNMAHQSREDTGIICPLCKQFVLPNHSISCGALEKPLSNLFRTMLLQQYPPSNPRADLIGFLDEYIMVYVSRGWYSPAMKGVLTPKQLIGWWKGAQGAFRALDAEYWRTLALSTTFKQAFKETQTRPVWTTTSTTPDDRVDSPELAWWLIRTQQTCPESITLQQGMPHAWNAAIHLWWKGQTEDP